MTDDAAARLAEDRLYAFVYEEIENGHIDKAAQARAIAEAGSDKGLVQLAYIKHRIEGIKAEIEFSTEQASSLMAREEKMRKEAINKFNDQKRPFVLRKEIYATFILCLLIILLFVFIGFL